MKRLILAAMLATGFAGASVLDELTWRGLIAHSTDLEALRMELASGPITLYTGYDPTAASLHVGHMAQTLTARRFQLAGHRPLALVGGSAAVARQLHIRIEFFADGGSEGRRRTLARFGAAMVALLFGLITVLSVRTVWDDYRFEETSPGIGVPQWWYSIWLPVLCALTTVRAVQVLARLRGRPSSPGARL